MHQQRTPVPQVTAEITFLTQDEGGRKVPPSFSGPHQYMPHIVIQPREVRNALVDELGVGTELYEGIDLVERPSDYRAGTAGIFVFNLMSYPQHQYSLVQPGATFTVREGPHIVAHGVVKVRAEPAAG